VGTHRREIARAIDFSIMRSPDLGKAADDIAQVSHYASGVSIFRHDLSDFQVDALREPRRKFSWEKARFFIELNSRKRRILKRHGHVSPTE